MIPAPYAFDPELTDPEFAKLGVLSLRWAHLENLLANCLKLMLRLGQNAREELKPVMKGIQYVRNNVIHATVEEHDDEGHVFHLRSKLRSLTKAQVFSVEEIANYAAHLALGIRYALGFSGGPGHHYAWPDRPKYQHFFSQ